jgi:hypothetical protein
VKSQTNQLKIYSEVDNSEFALPKVAIKQNAQNADEFTATGSLTLKELILFHLWNMQRTPEGNESTKLAAHRSATIIENLVESIRIDPTKNPKAPSVKYDLINLSGVEVVMEQEGVNYAIPDKSNPEAYYGYFFRLVTETLQTPPVVLILKAILLDYIGRPAKPTKQKAQLAPKGGELAGNLKINIHSLRQNYGDQKDVPDFDKKKIERWEKKYGTPVTNEIDRYGIDLTDLQHKITEGILMGLTQTRYQGNVEPKTSEEIALEFPTTNKPPKIYDNIELIPKIRVQQRELARLCGVDEENRSEYAAFLNAFTYLYTTQFCFFYSRLAYDTKGRPIKDERGDWKKHDVEAIDTLFKVKILSDLGVVQYYEIEPSPLFLDQHESYFVLVPHGWREEVKAIVGAKRASSYTMKFLLYLRLQFEERRRKNASNSKRKIPYELRTSWVEIARTLKMPESVYKGQKGRATKIIEQAYQVAISTGYLKAVKHTAGVDVLVLNPDKYPTPGGAIEGEVRVES